MMIQISYNNSHDESCDDDAKFNLRPFDQCSLMRKEETSLERWLDWGIWQYEVRELESSSLQG